jgi:hypothetical protein
MTWQTERPLRPPAGIDLVDKICVAADQRERRQAAAPDVMQQMLQSSMMTQQLMAKLIDILANKLLATEPTEPAPDAPKPKVKEKKA